MAAVSWAQLGSASTMIGDVSAQPYFDLHVRGEPAYPVPLSQWPRSGPVPARGRVPTVIGSSFYNNKNK